MEDSFNLNIKGYRDLFKDIHIHIAKDQIKDALKVDKKGDKIDEEKDKDNVNKDSNKF